MNFDVVIIDQIRGLTNMEHSWLTKLTLSHMRSKNIDTTMLHSSSQLWLNKCAVKSELIVGPDHWIMDGHNVLLQWNPQLVSMVQVHCFLDY